MNSSANVVSALKAGWDGLLDLVYPPRCLLCERLDRPAVCDECAAAFTPVPEPFCPRCGRPIDEAGASCRTCRERMQGAEEEEGWAFDAARACAIYEGAIRHGIHRLKYDGAEMLGEPLGAYLANRCVVGGLFPEATLRQIGAVVPVPMHPSRERARGYNQARLLAMPIAEMLGVPLLPPDLLRRTRRTPPQVRLGGAARRGNLREAFAVTKNGDMAAVSGKDLLLIDDVFTTGATVDACARALKDAGARSVIVVTLAAGG